MTISAVNREYDLDPAKQDERDLAARQARELAAEQAEADIRWLMDQKAGRRIVWRLLGQAGVHQTVFNSDHAVHSFNEGRRSAGTDLLAEVAGAGFEAYIVMLRENSEAPK